jgi:hypothetical protein
MSQYKHPSRARWLGVQLPAGGDADLARLLTGAGTLHEQLLNQMGAYADPAWRAQRQVSIPAELAGTVGEQLLAVGRDARDAGDPGAGAVFELAKQLGAVEPEPEPVPAPAPYPAGY